MALYGLIFTSILWHKTVLENNLFISDSLDFHRT